MRQRGFSRRDFVKCAALGTAAVVVRPILGLGSARAANGGGGVPGRFMVIVYLFGGNDGVNMVAPVSLPSYVSRRPTLNLVQNLPAGETLHDLNGNHALHYAMPGLKQMWDDGDLHIVNKVSYPSPNQSHFTSRDVYSFGIRNYEAQGDGRGWLGRFSDLYWADPVDPLGVLSVGLSKQPDFRADVSDPLVLYNVSSFQIDSDSDYLTDHQLREYVARDIANTEPDPPGDPALTLLEATRSTYPLVTQVQTDLAGWVDPGTYPNTTIGRNMRTVSNLLHAQTTWGTQVLYTGFGGFDTHSGQHSGTGGQNLQEGLFRNLDQALTAFADDLKARNRWNDCVILVTSEFGRRCFENGSRGTDHGHGGVFLVAGGNVRGNMAGPGYTGQLVDADLQASWLPFTYDFRDIYGRVVQNHLGVDPGPLFPDPAYVPNLASVDVI